MKLYNQVARHIMAPVLDYSRGTRTLKCLAELERTQWWPREKILELQNQRLGQLLEHAYGNVPYYRRLFDEHSLRPGDIKNTADLARLPVLTKELVRKHSHELMAQGFPAGKLVRLSTGGSTGEPLAFCRTRSDQYNWSLAAAERAFSWAGYELGDKVALFSVVRPYSSELARLGEMCKRFFRRTILLDAKKISLETLPFFAQKLQSFQPEFIRGYPSALELLARFIEKDSEYKIRPRAIITGGEQLYEHQRKLFKEVFKCETFCYYSSWEVHAMAAECTAHKGFHVAAEHVVIEIVDEEACPVTFGREGRILITNLHNYAMPFIRYELGDLGVASDQMCPCGRSLPLLAKLSGRTSDVMRTKSGKTIPGAALIFPFRAVMGVAQFRIVQESLERVNVSIKMDGDYSKEHLAGITRKIGEQYRLLLGEDIDVNVELVERIPTTKDGKRRVVVSNLSGNG